MATIGRPDNGNNPFGAISMASKNSPKSVGQELNRISGYRENSKFVDAKDHNSMGKDGFIKLLSHQLSNQDPMNPMDQKDFAADLAQFSQLEQMTNMNATLKEQNQNANAEKQFYGASFLGKKVVTRGTSLKYNGVDRATVPFSLPRDATKVIVRIVDEKNQLVQQLEYDRMNKGAQTVEWDGIATDNAPAQKGDYQIQVYAWDEGMQPFAGETKSSGLVTGVTFENGETILKVDGKKSIFLRDVESFEMVRDNDNNNAATVKSALNSYNQINAQQ